MPCPVCRIQGDLLSEMWVQHTKICLHQYNLKILIQIISLFFARNREHRQRPLKYSRSLLVWWSRMSGAVQHHSARVTLTWSNEWPRLYGAVTQNSSTVFPGDFHHVSINDCRRFRYSLVITATAAAPLQPVWISATKQTTVENL